MTFWLIGVPGVIFTIVGMSMLVLGLGRIINRNFAYSPHQGSIVLLVVVGAGVLALATWMLNVAF